MRPREESNLYFGIRNPMSYPLNDKGSKTIEHKKQISNTFTSVSDFSFSEKNDPLLEEKNMNKFLDAILDFKSMLSKKTKKLNKLNVNIEKLTWINDGLDKGCLKALNDLISSAKDLRSSLVRQYVNMDSIRSSGIAKDEIKDFKYSIDELREIYSDLESVYFFLPNIPEFKETTKELSLI